jgi:hypothetical protein
MSLCNFSAKMALEAKMDDVKEALAIYSDGEVWIPKSEDLKLIEKLAYNNIVTMSDIATVLGVTLKQIAFAVSRNNDIVHAVKKGKLRALLDLNKSLMEQATGVTEPNAATVTAAKYLLGARFDYDERNRYTEAQIKQISETIKQNYAKLNLEKERLRYQMDHNAAKMASEASEETLYRWSSE